MLCSLYLQNLIYHPKGAFIISLIIPTLEVDEGKKEVLDRCIKSLVGEYDELIIINDKDLSLAKKINIGLSKAKGDYLVVSNDDILLKSGHLKDLCHKGEVHSPVVHGGIDKTFHGHMWCLPRKVYEKVGGYDETCPGVYYQDSLFWVRLIQAGIPVIKNEAVHINHPEPGRTLKHLTNNNNDLCREWFISKVGKGYLRLVE